MFQYKNCTNSILICTPKKGSNYFNTDILKEKDLNFYLSHDIENAACQFFLKKYRLLVIDVHLLRTATVDSFKCHFKLDNTFIPVIVIAPNCSLENMKLAVQYFATDMIINRPKINIHRELKRLLIHFSTENMVKKRTHTLLEMSLFRSLNLTNQEMNLIQSFNEGFPSNKILCYRLGVDNVGTAGKYISNILNKLGLDDRSQLASFLTYCSLFKHGYRNIC